MHPTNKHFWAKTTNVGMPGCEVWQHSVAAAEVAKQLITLRPDLQELLPDGIVPLIGVHDVGKVTPGFQTKCTMWKGPDGKTDAQTLLRWACMYEDNHAYMSQCIVWDYYKECKQSRLGRHWGYYVGAHHGMPQNDYKSFKETKLPADWKEECFSLIRFIEKMYGNLPDASKQSDSIKRLISGLMIVSDWVASNELCFPMDDRSDVDYVKCASNSLSCIGLNRKESIKKNRLWETLFPHCHAPHPIQQYMWNLPPKKGVYVIEDAMGGGKTEAALAFAYHMMEKEKASGIYFALPTQTTSNRLFTRFQQFLSNCGISINEQSIQLAHGNSWLLREKLYDSQGVDELYDTETRFSELRHWFSSSKRALLAPFGVGTIDQALMGIVAVKHRDVRAFALAGKIVILDEVHSYDIYTGNLLTALVRQLEELGATVIILSATLTRFRTAELMGINIKCLSELGYPLVSLKTDTGMSTMPFINKYLKTIQTSVVEMTLQQTAVTAYSHAMRGKCVLWICNTVSNAQNAFSILKGEACEGGPEIGLLHARFPYWRREELEKQWIDVLGKGALNRPCGCVLVATQVVEQSVDIDSDFLITELAPMDMLLQRSGRLFRHDRPNRPCSRAEMLVVVPDGVEKACKMDIYKDFLSATGASSKVYSPFVLWRTWQILRDVKCLKLPTDIRELIEETYSENREHMGSIGEEAWKDLVAKSKKMEQLSRLNQAVSAGVVKDREGVFTRYGEIDSAEIILLRNKPIYLDSNTCIYAPLNGIEFTVEHDCWEFKVAKSISINVVRVPAWMVGELKPDPLLHKYGMNGIFPFFILANGDLQYYTGDSSSLSWNPLSGIRYCPRSHQTNEKSEFMY